MCVCIKSPFALEHTLMVKETFISFLLFFHLPFFVCFTSCTCKFLTYIANMLFSLLVCYFEGRLRSAGSSSPPPSFSLSLSVSRLLSHTLH